MNLFPGKGMQKCAVRALAALVTIATLVLLAGCGNGGRPTIIGGNDAGFSNASLSGHYAFTLRGVGTPDNANPFFFVEGGVFTADGNGNLTSITDDFIENFQAGLNTQTTGSYTIRPDGSGDLTFNFGGTVAQYHVTLSDDSHFYMEEDEGFNTSAGSGEKQDTSTFGTVPSGTFVVQTHDLLSANSKVGVTTWNSGQITGSGDVLSGGVVSPVTITGSVQSSGSSTGRGTLTISDNIGTSHYVYYVVSSTRIRLFNTDNLISLGLGQAEAQSGGPFSLASLNGNYVFGSAGETTNVDGIHTVGLFAADGAGNVTTGSFDFVHDGNVVTSVTLGAPSFYTVDSDGHVALTLNLSTGVANVKHMFLVNASRALFLVSDPVNVEDGTLDLQTGNFSNTSLNGQAAFFMDGFDTVFKDRVGTLTPNGSGSISTAYRSSFFDPVNVVGGFQDNAFSGTYTVSGNGRATAQLPGFTNNLIFYLSSSDTGYFLQADSGVDIGGALKLQTGP